MPHVNAPALVARAHLARRFWLAVAVIGLGGWRCLAAAEAKASPADAADDPTRLPAFKVTGEQLEDFGFRISPDFDGERSTATRKIYTPVVDVVLPNTAASKAGVRPGDRILTSDGLSTANGNSSLTKWRGIQEKKWAEVATGKSGVTWTLEAETAGTLVLRTLKLQLPTPAPHWGSTIWRMPEDRTPVDVPEPGALAERAQQVLNNGIWMLLRNTYVRDFRLPIDATHPFFLCYQWTLWTGSTGHRIYVSRQRGRTDIILEAIAKEAASAFSRTAPGAAPERNLASATTVFAIEAKVYLTSPSAVLESAWELVGNNRQQEIPREAARAGFEAEMDFWLTRVGKVSPLWPLEVIASPTDATHR